MNAEVKALLWKEFRQLPRKRGAVVTATLFPILFLFVMPAVNIGAMVMGGSTNMVGVNLPPGLSSLGDDPRQMAGTFLIPLFVMITGLVLPSVMASYTIIAERERRTLELLVALPTSVGSILVAKLLAVVAISVAITFPLVAIDSVALLVLGLAGAGNVVGFFWLLVTALAYSTAGSILLGLLAGDYRTANNINGALIGPLLLVAMATLLLLPPAIGPAVLGALLLVGAAVLVMVAMRWLTFERLLG
ncbi:MAG: ABC transporter permease [Chloroflexota bacterium]